MVGSALLVLAFWGSNAEGQGPFFEVFLSDQIIERTLSLSAVLPSHAQLADINSVSGGSGGIGGAEQPRETDETPTIQESAVIAYSPVQEDYLDGFEERRSKVITYTVQEGDAISFIASDYGVSVNSILWANQISDPNSVSPGQELRIPPVNGVVHRVVSGETVLALAEKYSANSDEIVIFNGLPKSGALIEGDEIIIPDGKITTTTVLSAPTGTVVRSFSYLPDLNEYFLLPASGYNWGRIHGRNGVDVANSCGTAIYSASDGVVTASDAIGWNGGFGQYVKVRHSNGTETLYAHASRILVAVGEPVAKGQHIAVMGTTGRSTGCHLHFEVHGAQNPLAKY